MQVIDVKEVTACVECGARIGESCDFTLDGRLPAQEAVNVCHQKRADDADQVLTKYYLKLRR